MIRDELRYEIKADNSHQQHKIDKRNTSRVFKKSVHQYVVSTLVLHTYMRKSKIGEM